MTNYPKHIVAVTGLIHNPEGQILMIKSPQRGWECPGGQVEEGENLIQALQREVKEETGIQALIGNLVGIYSNIKPPTKLIFCFLGTYLDGELTTSAESSRTEWVDRTDLLGLIEHPAIYDRVKDMLNFTRGIKYGIYSTDPYQVYEVRHLNQNAITKH